MTEVDEQILWKVKADMGSPPPVHSAPATFIMAKNTNRELTSEKLRDKTLTLALNAMMMMMMIRETSTALFPMKTLFTLVLHLYMTIFCKETKCTTA